MRLKLNDYQFKTRRYISGLVNIIELHDNHNQKNTTDSQKQERKAYYKRKSLNHKKEKQELKKQLENKD